MDSVAVCPLKTATKLCLFSRPETGFSEERRGVMLRCGGREKEAEILMTSSMIEMKKLNEKCKGVDGGIQELMECLEREAIMGEDEGRQPSDYYRRALIFHNSSTLFHALKQLST